MKGKIIFLNGVSSSGKTTLAKTLQNTFNESTEKCADRIIELLNYPEKHTALKTLWLQRAK